MNPKKPFKQLFLWALDKAERLKFRSSGKQQALDASLFLALLNRDALAVRKHLGAGANPNAVNLRGENPLLLAAEYDLLECALSLLASGATPKRCPEAIQYAACFAGAELIVALAHRGADINGPDASDEDGETAPVLCAARHGNLAALDTLKTLGADLSATTGHGMMSAMHISTYFDHPAVLAWLIEQGSDVMSMDRQGDFPGIYASRHADGRCLNLLLAAGTPLDARGHLGRTMVMAAAIADAPVPLAILDAAGARFDLRSDPRHHTLPLTGSTAMDLALNERSQEALAWMAARQERLDIQEHLSGPAPKAARSLRI